MAAHQSYREAAAAVIARTLAAIPPAAELKVKRAALRSAYPFGERRYWPYRVWCSEVRYALGLARRPRPGQPEWKDTPGQQLLFEI